MPPFPKIPNFELKKFLGSGGAAEVFLAVDLKHSRLVAVKVLARSRFANAVAVRRFIKEAQTISRLHHPNIVRIHGTGKINDLHYMVMEFLPESLKARIRQRKPIGLQESLTIINQIAAALFYAHGKGFIHRDVKPDNIMFRADGTPVILDFGIARVLEATSQITRSGTSLGTPRYMSPEQLNAKRVDGRSDIYSLGVVLYEMISGTPPYKGTHTMSVVMKHINEPIPRLPGELAHCQPLIERMLAKERDKRVGSEAEWRELIKPLLKPFKLPRVGRENFAGLPSAKEREKTRLSIEGGRSDSEKSHASRPRPRPKRNPRRLLLLNLLLVLAVVVWAFFNYERIPGLLLSLGRAIVSWVSSLLAKI
ncbi:MAG: serine/threonine-protein kinase [Candidatus Aminicenantes bacterium]|nr:serine/threonine-protein kinase [Candidatus Aminicenantes bacterium]